MTSVASMNGYARLTCVAVLLAAVVLGLMACTRAEPGVRLADGCFVIEGEFWRPEFERFERLVTEHPEVRCLELRDSPGGATAAGLRIGAMARARGMRTVARGACVSACALAFLGGTERELGPPWRGAATYLHIHGSFDRSTGRTDPLFRDAIERWLTERTAGRMPPALVRAVVNAPQPAAGLYVPGGAGGAGRFCGAAAAEAEKLSCESIPGADSLTLGLVTH